MSLLDPKWKYTHSTATDIRKTFKKARTALAKSSQAPVRAAKLHLMPAPLDAAGSATRNHVNNDHPAFVAGRLGRRIGA